MTWNEKKIQTFRSIYILIFLTYIYTKSELEYEKINWYVEGKKVKYWTNKDLAVWTMYKYKLLQYFFLFLSTVLQKNAKKKILAIGFL